jgi:hypothetical protein
MCQHDFSGRRIFQHRNTDKWNLFLRNKQVDDFWFETECRQYLLQLRQRWDGRIGPDRRRRRTINGAPALTGFSGRAPTIMACMISCPERDRVREQTLRDLVTTDWGDEPVCVQLDLGQGENREQRQQENARCALQRSLETKAEYVLFLEDDLRFNRHLRHNLQQWAPLQRREVTLAGLYNPSLPAQACDVESNFWIVAPHAVFGSQAFLISRATVQYLVEHWTEIEGLQDIKMSRLAGQLKRPLLYHAPSLVQHVGTESVWGGPFHRATDFDPSWKAPG